MAYTIVSSNPSVTSDDFPQTGYIVGVNLQWSNNLRKIPTLGGSKNVPDIPKGQISVTFLVPPTGLWSGYTDLCVTGSTKVVDINGAKYNNTYRTGGSLATQEFGEGLKTVAVTLVYSVFGECSG